MTPLRTRIGGVDVSVDDAVQGHRQTTGADRRQQNPQKVDAGASIKLPNSDEVADEDKRK